MREKHLLVLAILTDIVLGILLVSLIGLLIHETSPETNVLPTETSPETEEPTPTETTTPTMTATPIQTVTPTFASSPTITRTPIPSRTPTDEPTKRPYVFPTPIIVQPTGRPTPTRR